MKQIAYLFSGLGSDERVFKYLDFGPNLDVKVIRWEQPDINETFSDYAKRLSTQITDKDPYYLGVSFGGMAAIEVDKILPAKKILLISSVKAANELPGTFAIGGKLGLYKLARVSLIQKESKFVFNIYGVQGDEHRRLLMDIFGDLDPTFFKWAIKQMMTWKHITDTGRLVHMHGTKDNAFPYKKLRNVDYSIEGGGHFMVFDRAHEVSEIIQKELA
jgi:pimeloyl-ACP methyl ester carboxylesterase